jgi:hypothetical protein
VEPQLCIYCNLAVADTVDHIPPKLLLAKPYPDNLLTVPSCFKCNSSFQNHDEYTRVIASVDLRNADHRAVKVNMPAILRSLQRSEAQRFSKYLANQATPSLVLGIDGKPFANLVEVDKKRLNATGERIIRGLHFIETKLAVPKTAQIRVASIPGVTATEPKPLIQQLAVLYSQCTDQRTRIVGDAFNYIAAFRAEFSVWLLLLYNEFAWAATISNQANQTNV